MNKTNNSWEIIQGDMLALLPEFEDGSFDALITDPPYASGAAATSARQQSTAKKYTSDKKTCLLPDFEGDAKDQRSWTNWMAEWLCVAKQKCKPGAPVCLFIDWRQLPSMTDALQWAGWTWRGILAWDKANSRPQRGRFKQQAEFVVWGSNGDMPVTRPVPVLPGAFRYANPSSKTRHHMTEKPLELMRQIVKICEPEGLILDPFAGSGTTVLAAVMEGYHAIGIELSKKYAQVAVDRMKMFEKEGE